MLFCLEKAEPHLLEFRDRENLPRILYNFIDLLPKIVQDSIVYVFSVHFSNYFGRVHLFVLF